jgi:TetR/AcrR family transcriptional regulator, regulator of cefoperazone and chloramphenicol sensitivity
MSQVAEDTKDRILEAAGRVFADKGFRDATVREICQAAAVNLAAVNYHFGDKERLYIESVKRAHRLRMEEGPMPEWPADVLPAQKLHDFTYAFLRRVMAGDESDDWQAQLMLRELMQPTRACEELVRDYVRPHFALLQGIIAELVPPETGELERHRIGFSIIGQCLHYRIAQPILRLLLSEHEFRQNDPAQLAAHISRWTLAALGAAPPVTFAPVGENHASNPHPSNSNQERRPTATRTPKEPS